MATIHKRSVFKLGDSLAVTLPISWVRYNHIKKGDKTEVITRDKKIEITLLPDNIRKS